MTSYAFQDPKGNVIKKWSNLTEPKFGVVNRTFPMDDKPVLGEWKIKAKAGVSSYVHLFLLFIYQETWDLRVLFL